MPPPEIEDDSLENDSLESDSVEEGTSEIDVQQVARQERLLAAAHVRLDLPLIDRLLHDDYLILQPGGRVESKQDVLTSYASGTRHWDRAAVDQLDIRIHGKTAIVVGRWRAAGRNGPDTFDYSARFLAVWLKGEDGDWRNVASQSTEMTS